MLEELILYAVPGYRGTGILDPKDVTEYLKSLPKVRRNENPTHIMFQDIIIPKDPIDPAIKPLMDDIISNIEKTFGVGIWLSDMWYINHGPYQQTYPHRHELEGNDWAVVYWAQTPQPCAPLEYYPLGIPGPNYTVEPKAGDYFVFPGTLLHGVRENASDDERISMSFNIKALVPPTML